MVRPKWAWTRNRPCRPAGIPIGSRGQRGPGPRPGAHLPGSGCALRHAACTSGRNAVGDRGLGRIARPATPDPGACQRASHPDLRPWRSTGPSGLGPIPVNQSRPDMLHVMRWCMVTPCPHQPTREGGRGSVQWNGPGRLITTPTSMGATPPGAARYHRSQCSARARRAPAECEREWTQGAGCGREGRLCPSGRLRSSGCRARGDRIRRLREARAEESVFELSNHVRRGRTHE
jgi:hypothetical protein